MIILYEKFSRALRWNTLESLLYQGLLVVHQIVLYNVISSSLYGIMSIWFSLIYLIGSCANIGLDQSLAPFFTRIMSDKTHVKRLLIPQIILQIFCLIVSVLGLYCYGHLYPSSLFFSSIPFSLLIIFGLLIISEALKKTTRLLLQLSFLNRITAYVEMVTIICYISSVWLTYAWTGSITLLTLFLPMLVISLGGLLFYSYSLYTLYNGLPESSKPYISITQRFIKNRALNYIIHMSHIAFSGNALVPIFAATFGLQTAGLFKLISIIAHSITILLNKIFGLTTEALFAHTKDMSLEIKRVAFTTVTDKLYQVLSGILMFFIVNHYFFITQQGSSTQLAILLFFIVNLSEYFFLAYEKFFIAQEEGLTLSFYTVITVSAMLASLLVTLPHGIVTTLITLIIVRMISFIAISLLAYYKWHIKPRFTLNVMYILCSFLITFTFFYLALSSFKYFELQKNNGHNFKIYKTF